jgi:hypothetical protein
MRMGIDTAAAAATLTTTITVTTITVTTTVTSATTVTSTITVTDRQSRRIWRFATEQVMSRGTARIQRIRRAAFAGAAVAWVGAMGLQAVLDTTYFNYPRTPDPAIGRTVPYEVKRVVVYITNDQRAVLDWVRWIWVGAGALLIISSVIDQRRPPPSNK